MSLSRQRLRDTEGPRDAEGPRQAPGTSLAPLRLGDAESGFLTQTNLLSVAGRLGPDWPTVALHLGQPYREVQRIRHEFRSVPSARGACDRRKERGTPSHWPRDPLRRLG